MSDVLIRGVAAADLERIDARASKLGLSRNEYLRRQIAQVAGREKSHVSYEDLQRAAMLAQDLLDDDVMRSAWS